jgi:phosphate:Na+ symporter
MSANLLSLSQGLMVMIGANIGTTTTAFVFTLSIEKYSLFFVIAGYILFLFKNRKLSNIGSIIIGFGILFLGIDIMNDGLNMVLDHPLFLQMMYLLSGNSLSGTLGGIIISALIQSSSVTIGLAQSLYAFSSISLPVAISMMLGANVGTTIASLIVVVSATKEAKIAVYVNIIFNLVGALVFLIFLNPFSAFLFYLESFIKNKKMVIAYSHLIFNIISSIIFYFIFNKIINCLSKKIDLEETLI